MSKGYSSGLVKDIPTVPHWQIITQESYVIYDGYDNDSKGSKLVVTFYTNKDEWIKDVQTLTRVNAEFFASAVTPAIVTVKVEVA
jgi:hypothetical protein